MAPHFGVPFGWGVGTGVTTLASLRAQARWAASAGFHSLWVSQIFGVDPLVALAVVGQEVPGVAELGSSVVPLTGRHPLALAAEALTAQDATGGRLTLGIGPSHAMVSEGFFGEPYGRAVERTTEFLHALLPLLRGERCDVDGTDLFAKGWLTIEAPTPGVLLAALGPRMLGLAGRMTDGTILNACGPRTIASHVVPRIGEAAAAVGRPGPRIVAHVTVAVTGDPARVRAASRAHNALYDELPSYRRALDREGVESAADLVVAGSLDAVTEGLLAYVEAGATDLRIADGSTTESEREATRAFLEDVVRSEAPD